MAKIGNSYEILNAIMQTDIIDWSEYVPFTIEDEGTLRQFGNILMDTPLVYNAFCETLVNKITYSVVSRAEFTNPLQRLWKGRTLGNIEDIFIDLADVKKFDINSDDSILFNKQNDNVRVSYYIFNVQRQYKITISRNQISHAFTNVENLNRFIEEKISSVYTSIEYDSYNLALYLFDMGIIKGSIKTKEIDTSNLTKVYSDLRADSNHFRFINSVYNKAGVKNNAPIERQMIIITADAEAEITVEVLASLFNLSIAEYTARRIMVDSFANVDLDRISNILGDYYVDITSELVNLADVYMLLIDERLAQIYSHWDGGGSFFNPHKEWENTFWTKTETYAISPFNNGLAYVSNTSTVTSIDITTNVGDDDTTITIPVGTSTGMQIVVNGTGLYNKDVIITNSDNTKVSVSKQNFITALAAGTATITVTSVQDSTVTATLTVTVE